MRTATSFLLMDQLTLCLDEQQVCFSFQSIKLIVKKSFVFLSVYSTDLIGILLALYRVLENSVKKRCYSIR